MYMYKLDSALSNTQELICHKKQSTNQQEVCILFEQILEAVFYKTAATQPVTSHLENHPSNTSNTF